MNESDNSKSQGLGVTHRTWQCAIDEIRTRFSNFIPGQVVTLTPEMCVRASGDPEFRSIIDNAGIVVADGVGVAWGERRLTGKRTERVPGIELAEWAMEEVDRIGGRLYLLGATEDVIKRAAATIEKRYPRIELTGHHNGYFGESEGNDIVEQIRSGNPHLVLVGLGSPKQEIFISGYLDELNCAVCMGVGGSFDVWSGSIRRAPGIFRKTGTEWLYRTISQPAARLARIPVLVRFAYRVLNGTIKSY